MRDVAVGDRLDGFDVTELIARGAMGSVFKAVDRATGRVVALKIPYVQYESDVVFFERICREEAIGRAVEHPNVVKVLQTPVKSRIYVAMEFVEGRPLSSILRDAPLPVEQALDIARQVCDGLAALHAHGIVHRDVKPENIHVTAPGQVKILDFGIALLPSARRLTWAGLSAVLGTPDYMAPEQIRGRRGDPRTDVYAVGTLLYEMLTRRLPFEASNAAAVLHAKTHREPIRPSRHMPGLDRALEVTILRAIARDPRDRYASAVEFLAALAARAAPSHVDSQKAHRRRSRWNGARAMGVAAGVALVLLGLGSLL